MKKCLAIILFIVIIFTNSQVFCFTKDDINYDTMSTLTTDNIGEFINTFREYIGGAYVNLPYYFISHDSNQFYIFNTLTPFYWKDNYNFGGQAVNSDMFYGISSNESNYMKWIVDKSSGLSFNTSTILSQAENIWYSGLKTDYFSNYDVYNDIKQVNEFDKNFDYPIIDSGGSSGCDIDMTETNNILNSNFGLIKGFLFLICLYLSCKAIYGVIWWLYNKTLL